MFRQLLAAIASGLLACASSFASAPETAGEYNGTIDGGTFADSASFRLVLGKSGRGSLSVRVADGRKHVVVVRDSETADGSLLIGNSARIRASLKVTRDNEAGAILWGSLTHNGLSHSIAAAKATNGGAVTGRHTFVIDGESSGIAVARVTKGGHVTGSAIIWQRRVAFGGRLDAFGSTPLYVAIGSRASLVGGVLIGKPASAGTANIYGGASPHGVEISGSPYDSRQPAIATSSALTVKLGGDVRGSAASNGAGTINGLLHDGSSVRLKVTSATGVVSGSNLRGIVLQNIGAIAGATVAGEAFAVYVTGSEIGAQLQDTPICEALNAMVFGGAAPGGVAEQIAERADAGHVQGIVWGWAMQDPVAIDQLFDRQVPNRDLLLNGIAANAAADLNIGRLGFRGDDGGFLRIVGVGVPNGVPNDWMIVAPPPAP